MNADIRINVVIKATPEKVYKAVTTQEGIESWWCKHTTAKPEVEFVNIFIFGKFRNEMEVTKLVPNKRVEWKCINSIEEWIGTVISFDMEEKEGTTLLRFAQSGWRAATDTFAGCTYDWALFMKSLKSFCETGTGTPS
ncbi:SRPBCC domain-containing protein [Pseudoflavitalea sp. X16]|uniref:SRPBCC family protein n=1 Tax=Paraflavitalea devenefica TaxID=2716334 RepID=UPI00141FC3E2|nr:SRPBCC domain-containing protein [Paraflavitalea devenefica]NII25509.1 SRPBCC domain-containing protein [Paraflavitalea devenefica]